MFLGITIPDDTKEGYSLHYTINTDAIAYTLRNEVHLIDGTVFLVDENEPMDSMHDNKAFWKAMLYLGMDAKKYIKNY